METPAPPQRDSPYTTEDEDVLAVERRHLGLKDLNEGAGLALSGGGVRSASFGLGVMQAMVKFKVLRRMDYMSTVSGGGYLGSALTWALSQDPAAGTVEANFPLGHRHASRGPGHVGKKGMENKLLNFIRQHSIYLTPTPRLDMLSFIPVVIRSMVISLVVYAGMITAVLTALIYCTSWVTAYVVPNCTWLEKPGSILLFAGLALLGLIVIIALPFSVSTFTRFMPFSSLRYSSLLRHQEAAGLMLKCALVLIVLGSLPFILDQITNKIIAHRILPTGTSLFGAAVGLWQYWKARNKDTSGGLPSEVLIYAGVLSLLYGLLLFAYLMATRRFLDGTGTEFLHPWAFVALVIITLLLGYLTNLNLVGPHNVWRSRLMEAFMPSKEAVENNSWRPAHDANAALLEKMCTTRDHRPYHILNTNVILPNSTQVDYSSRGGDNFILSPLYCGSAATGWQWTAVYQKVNSRGMTLATAMATSAAALNPNAAVSGRGFTRKLAVSFLLSLLNLRLGYWTSHPDLAKKPAGPPNFLVPGLWSELLRNGLDENSQLLQLSDGGHFENLALYELIRRRQGLIILSDGGADPLFNFDDLANAVEKVRVDFGAQICFIDGLGLDRTTPGTLDDTPYNTRYGIAERGFAIARINYADGSTGVLLYVKLTMTLGLPTDVMSYKGVYPAFPHQSTSDQFFDENQFEAYRELGFSTASQLFQTTAAAQLFANDAPQAEWVKAVRAALLVTPVKA